MPCQTPLFRCSAYCSVLIALRPSAGDVDDETVGQLLSSGDAEKVSAGVDSSILGDAPAKPAVPAALTEQVGQTQIVLSSTSAAVGGT